MNQEAVKATKCLFLTILIATAYVVMAKWGFLYALNPGFATAFFPSSGIAVAALLIFGIQIWPAVFLGSLIANFMNSISTLDSVSFYVNFGIAIGSTLQTAIIAYILGKLTPSNYLLSTHRHVFIFICTVTLCCLISSTIGIAALFLADLVSHDSLIQNWTTWWVGDVMGIWIFTPLILSWTDFYSHKSNFNRKLECFFLLFLVLILGFISFGGWIESRYPLEYLLFPCLLWAIFRFKPPMVTFLLAVISFIAVWGTSSGFGTFAQASSSESIIFLQLFLGVMTVMTLLLTSVLSELNHNNEVLEEYNQALIEQNLLLHEIHDPHKKS